MSYRSTAGPAVEQVDFAKCLAQFADGSCDREQAFSLSQTCEYGRVHPLEIVVGSTIDVSPSVRCVTDWFIHGPSVGGLLLSQCDLTSLTLVRTQIVVDAVEGVAEVIGQGVGGGEGVDSGLDVDGLVAASRFHEFAD